MKKKFFNYKARAAELIDNISSKLSRLQIIIQDIKKIKASKDLDVALTIINLVNNEVYTIAKYHLVYMRELTPAYTKKPLMLVEQKIKDEMTPKEDTANKVSSKGKSKPLNFHCNKLGYISFKRFK